ncbi:hypothetical protein CRE_31512 [Caenorhabditis remanei]|uniref:Uncharacterized protein n=1 Tax=Caenorhabditis remanei TaxID=31234 RepID=E3NGI2_CAERE|nr:hypothetical protein CRE_31512 [Caenorhabditis remanei]
MKNIDYSSIYYSFTKIVLNRAREEEKGPLPEEFHQNIKNLDLKITTVEQCSQLVLLLEARKDCDKTYDKAACITDMLNVVEKTAKSSFLDPSMKSTSQRSNFLKYYGPTTTPTSFGSTLVVKKDRGDTTNETKGTSKQLSSKEALVSIWISVARHTNASMASSAARLSPQHSDNNQGHHNDRDSWYTTMQKAMIDMLCVEVRKEIQEEERLKND